MNQMLAHGNTLSSLASDTPAMSKVNPLKQVQETAPDNQKQTLVTLYIGEQLFGLPIEQVRDIFLPGKIFKIPMTVQEVAGVINLRGRIVTVFDMRTRLGLKKRATERTYRALCITVLLEGELYGLLVDRVGEILDVHRSSFEPPPSTIGPRWKEFCSGVYPLDGAILVQLDVERFLNI